MLFFCTHNILKQQVNTNITHTLVLLLSINKVKFVPFQIFINITNLTKVCLQMGGEERLINYECLTVSCPSATMMELCGHQPKNQFFNSVQFSGSFTLTVVYL